MRISFEQTGGFAGLAIGCRLQTDGLSEPERGELEKLIDEAGLEPCECFAEGCRDLRVYEIVIEEDAGRPGSGRGRAPVRAVFDERSVPPAARRLVAFLRARSGPQPPQKAEPR
jgi:hypothetical protein